LKTHLLKILILAVLNSLCLAIINDVALSLWGRPRGVSFGIMLYYLWIFLSVQGLATIALFYFVGPKTSIFATFFLILSIAWFLFPGSFSPAYVAVVLGAAILSALFFLREARHRARRQNEPL